MDNDALTFDDVVQDALRAASACLRRVAEAGPSTMQQAAVWVQTAAVAANIARGLDESDHGS